MTLVRNLLRRTLPFWLTIAVIMYAASVIAGFSVRIFPNFAVGFVAYALYWAIVYALVRWSQIPNGAMDVDELYASVTKRTAVWALSIFAGGVFAITLIRGIEGAIDKPMLVLITVVAVLWPLSTMAEFRRVCR